ncbi:hypothetical protein NQ317_004014 [Molorchus minor]|uniref:UDP-glucuronosyltransferase n=1 Tax=Molorchus minor TaxID=1323400 RepID=A0ABQ9JVB0_9CUCU|nr:hypothetical protein NQ317_004014 [Molorchus minor]
MLTANLMEQNENITQIDLSEIYNILETSDVYSKLATGENMLQILLSTINTMSEVLEYELKEVQSILHSSTKFDLVITEFHIGLGHAIAQKLGVPSIGVMSMDGHYTAHDAVGNPCHPVSHPDYDLAFSIPLGFKERVISTCFSIIFRLVDAFIFTAKEEELLYKYVGEIAPLSETVKRVSMLFINVNPIFNEVRPVGPKTINVGGIIHFSEPKPLPQDIQNLLDNARNGVVYFSLGTNVHYRHLNNKTISTILETFSILPFQILWKLEIENLKEKPKNVEIMKWIPQQDVLRHKNIKLFITQGGIQSMEEAVINHVPMIGLPFFGDQHHNVNKMVGKGFGISLDYTKLDVVSFKNTILEVISNPKYKENIKIVADIIQDQPMTGLEKAVWWTEYVLRHGDTEHFRNPIVDLPLYKYLLLDVLSFLLIVIAVVIFVWYKISKVIYLNVFSGKKNI